MPYGPNEVPTAVKNQSKGVISLFKDKFNEAHEACKKSKGSDCETKARMAAWGAVKKKYYQDPSSGKWKPRKRAYALTKGKYDISDEDLPVNVRDLPDDGIEMWIATYNANTDSGKELEAAKDVAWDAVKRDFFFDPTSDAWKARTRTSKDVNDAVERAASHNSNVLDEEPIWGEVDQSVLPREAFAIAINSDDRGTWKFAHHYEKDGKLFLSKSGLRAAAILAHNDERAAKHIARHMRDVGMGSEAADISARQSLGDAFIKALDGVNILVASRKYKVATKDEGKFKFFVPAEFKIERDLDADEILDGKGDKKKEERIYLVGEACNVKPDRYKARMTDGFIDSMIQQSKGLPIFDWHTHSMDGSLGFVERVFGDSSKTFNIKGRIESPDVNDRVKLILRKINFGIPVSYSVFGRVIDAQVVENKKDYVVEFLKGEPLEYSATMVPGSMVTPVEVMYRSLDLSGVPHMDLSGKVHRGCIGAECGMCSCGHSADPIGDFVDRLESDFSNVREEVVETATEALSELKEIKDKSGFEEFLERSLHSVVMRSIEGGVRIAAKYASKE